MCGFKFSYGTKHSRGKAGGMTFEGVWNNISGRFPSLILLSSVRNLYHNLAPVASENSKCSATYNSGPKCWGGKESPERSSLKSHQSQGSLADFPSNLTTTLRCQMQACTISFHSSRHPEQLSPGFLGLCPDNVAGERGACSQLGSRVQGRRPA